MGEAAKGAGIMVCSKFFTVALLAVTLVASCARGRPDSLNVATAPTAPILREGKTFIGVVDSAALVPEIVCIAADRPGQFAVILSVDDEQVVGEWAIFDPAAVPQTRGEFGGGNVGAELQGQSQSSGIVACVQLVATHGLSVYRLRWVAR